MTYQESIDFLFSQLPMFSRTGAAAYKPGLGTSRALDSFFGHPHRRFRSIHIAGTNGKGSVSHMLASVLQAQGFKTALYTSPHLTDFRERMRIDGTMIPQEDVVEFVERWKACAYDGHPSFFELTMMMAFDWFAANNVDFAVIETGMGGRLDSTNIITPEACVITNISPDHTQFLGRTLQEIAGEKAGIIKPGIPVVIGEAEGDVREVFERKAAETGSPVVFAEDSPRLFSSTRYKEGGWLCTSEEGEWLSPLGGDYQLHNFETVLHAVDMLRSIGIDIDSSSVTTGLGNVTRATGLRGRWTIVSRSPIVIADTGHNIAGMQHNVRQLEKLRMESAGRKIHIVIGFVADKDIDTILSILPADARYYVSNADIPRAMPASELIVKFKERGLSAESYPSVKDAFREAVRRAAPSDVIFIGGSTFIVADFFK